MQLSDKIRKTAIYTLATLALSAVSACRGNEAPEAESTPVTELDTVLVAKGMKDAEQVGYYRAGSPERENALLSLRAAEQRLRNAGMYKSADSYLAGAKLVLDSLGVK